MEYYYDAPFQVYYLRPDNYHYSFGIAFHEWVVDIKDGTPFSTKEILEKIPCEEEEYAIIERMEWLNIADWCKS